MVVRPLEPADLEGWISLRSRLWPQESSEDLEEQGRVAIAGDPPLVVFVADDGGILIGFIEISLRSYAEGCSSSPVPYIEGWFVSETARRRGVGGALMNAAIAWARQRGYAELGSDTESMNRLSREAHAALGFHEVETLTVFRKPL